MLNVGFSHESDIFLCNCYTQFPLNILVCTSLFAAPIQCIFYFAEAPAIDFA